MKRVAIICGVILLMLTSCQSNEDKALELIDQYMKTILYDYDSYEPTQIKIDSAYTTIYIMEETRKFAMTIIETEPKLEWEKRQLKSNQSSMAIWKPDGWSSEYSRHQYNEAKEDVAENKKNISEFEKTIQDAKDGIKSFAESFEPRYIGWAATLNYRCKTGGGHPAIGNGIFWIDPTFENIEFAISDFNEEEVEIMEIIKKYSGLE